MATTPTSSSLTPSSLTPSAPAADGSTGLDPADWEALRSRAHRMVDDSLDRLACRREEPVWQPMPDEVRGFLDGPLPRDPEGAETAYRDLVEQVVPYSMGNDQPRFWGWYMGAGNPVGNLADLLASVLNPNMGGGDHARSSSRSRWSGGAPRPPATPPG